LIILSQIQAVEVSSKSRYIFSGKHTAGLAAQQSRAFAWLITPITFLLLTTTFTSQENLRQQREK
jgi:hypothetical protein